MGQDQDVAQAELVDQPPDWPAFGRLGDLTKLRQRGDGSFYRANFESGMLVAENLRSVRFRYEDVKDDLEGLPGPIERDFIRAYTFERTQDMATVAILKALDCYEYQSCETDDWPQSEAFAFCDSLGGSLVHRLPGYDDAPWEITQRGAPTISLMDLVRAGNLGR